MSEKKEKTKEPKKKKQRSLQGRVFRISLFGVLALGIVSLLIGLGIYAVVLADQYITKAFNLSRMTSVAIEDVIDVEKLADSFSSTYLGLSEEERKDDPFRLQAPV